MFFWTKLNRDLTQAEKNVFFRKESLGIKPVFILKEGYSWKSHTMPTFYPFVLLLVTHHLSKRFIKEKNKQSCFIWTVELFEMKETCKWLWGRSWTSGDRWNELGMLIIGLTLICICDETVDIQIFRSAHNDGESCGVLFTSFPRAIMSMTRLSFQNRVLLSICDSCVHLEY